MIAAIAGLIERMGASDTQVELLEARVDRLEMCLKMVAMALPEDAGRRLERRLDAPLSPPPSEAEPDETKAGESCSG